MSIATGMPTTWDTPVEEKPGGSLTMSADGLLTRTRTINVRTTDPEWYINWHEAHPHNSEFLLTGANAQEIGPDLWKLSLVYTGPPTSDIETHRYNTDTGSNQIEVHHDMATLKDYAKTDEDGAFVEWDPPLSDPENLTGVESYLDTRMTYNRTIVRANSPGYLATVGGDFFDLTNIFTNPPGNLINIAGRDWLLIMAGIEIIGGALRIQQSYQLSGPNGWNQHIYELYV